MIGPDDTFIEIDTFIDQMAILGQGRIIMCLSNRGKSGWKATQINCTAGVRGSLHTNRFLTRLESLGVKNKNAREAIRNRMVQKPLSMSDIILEFFFIALNSKTEWTLQSLPTEITNKNKERYNLHLQASGTRLDQIA